MSQPNPEQSDNDQLEAAADQAIVIRAEKMKPKDFPSPYATKPDH